MLCSSAAVALFADVKVTSKMLQMHIAFTTKRNKSFSFQ